MNQTPDQLHADLMADTVAFPVLSAAELAECTEFGTRCSFAPGEEIFGAGSQSFDCYVIVSGDVCIMDVSTDEPTCIVRYGAGQFTGDIDLFTGRRAVGSWQAATVVEAIRIAPDRLREMLVRQPTLGARIWRAFQRRHTASTTCLHVPSIGLIVAGDAAYNGVHLHLSESPDQQKRQEWIAALDKMESLKPRAVIAGHKRVGNVDSPKILGETRRYIRDFERIAMQTTTARELYDQMLKLYPDWGNPGALWTSVHAVKP